MLVEDLNEVEEVVCECEHCVVVLAVADFVSPVASESLQLLAA